MKSIVYVIVYMESVEKLSLKVVEIMEQNKQIYQLLESIKRPAYNNTNYQPKEVDRESTEYKNKRNVSIEKLNEQVIKEPKQSSLDCYQVKYMEETKKYV